jgi:hypothetical protein
MTLKGELPRRKAEEAAENGASWVEITDRTGGR